MRGVCREDRQGVVEWFREPTEWAPLAPAPGCSAARTVRRRRRPPEWRLLTWQGCAHLQLQPRWVLQGDWGTKSQHSGSSWEESDEAEENDEGRREPTGGREQPSRGRNGRGGRLRVTRLRGTRPCEHSGRLDGRQQGHRLCSLFSTSHLPASLWMEFNSLVDMATNRPSIQSDEILSPTASGPGNPGK